MRQWTALAVVGSALLGGCVGLIGGDGSDGGDGPEVKTSGTFVCDPDEAELTPAAMQRLARAYVTHSLEELLAPMDESARDALMQTINTRLQLIPSDDDEGNVSQDHVDAMFNVAVGIAAAISDDPSYASAMLPMCAGASLDDEACFRSFIESYGRRALRRPLSADEVDDFRAFYLESEAEGLSGLATTVARLVAHPAFYYRLDADGEDESEGVYRLSKWELLSKVTFLFWASAPDDVLYDFVEQSDVTSDEGLAALLDEVLDDPRARRGIVSFYNEWLELDHTPNPGTAGNMAAVDGMVGELGFAALPDTHRQAMIDDVLALTQHYTFAEEGRLEDILTSRYSFATTPELAAIYGVEVWDGDSNNLVSFPEGERSGLLTRAAMVSTNGDVTRPIMKGLAVRKHLLCTDTPEPPPNLQITPLVHTPANTSREAVEEATADVKCQSCHSVFNPLGFASESYDPLGRYRTQEARFDAGSSVAASMLDVDTRVTVDIGDETVTARDAVELSEHLAASGEVHTCMVSRYFAFVNGREADDKADGCVLTNMRERLTEDGGSIRAMLKESVMQRSFRLRRLN